MNRGAAPSPKVRREEAVKATLDSVRSQQDRRARVERDPIGFVRSYQGEHDLELAGLMASSFAFGNVTTILAKLREVARRLPGSLAKRIDSLGLDRLMATLSDFRHRVFVGEDVARLLYGARRVQHREGSLGNLVVRVARAETSEKEALRAGLGALVEAIRAEGGLLPQKIRRGPSHILPDLGKGGGAKRLLLFARWMVRRDDGVDLGLWNIPMHWLVIPVDTHIHKLSRNLGFTRSRAVNWNTAVEITEALAKLDASDPVGYDFALCHLGMLQQCPSRRDTKLCEGCGVKPICGHWPAGRQMPGVRLRK